MATALLLAVAVAAAAVIDASPTDPWPPPGPVTSAEGFRVDAPAGWFGRLVGREVQIANFKLPAVGAVTTTGEDPIKAMTPGAVLVTIYQVGRQPNGPAAVLVITPADFQRTPTTPAGHTTARGSQTSDGRTFSVEIDLAGATVDRTTLRAVNTLLSTARGLS